jgi:CHAT domain-containing protein
MIPLHAVPVSGQILDDVGEIHLAPSAAVYGACRKRATQQRPQHLVGIANPDGTLPGSEAELAAICRLFELRAAASCATRAAATREWVLDHISKASHLHLACHGASNLASTAGGILRLADEDELTMDDLLDGRLATCRLAVASACQSGHYSMGDVPDEFTGLPSGFLQAGAACAVVSLWQVHDDITSLFMTRFYELLNPIGDSAEQRPIGALRQARAWLRQLTTQEAEAFRDLHPQLLRRAGNGSLADKPDVVDSELSYSSPEHWAAFAAWGC